MKSARIISLASAVLFLCVWPVSAARIHFRDGQTHDIDYSINDEVWIDQYSPGKYTTVNLLDGADAYILRGFNNSRINVSGGSSDYIFSYDSGLVNISGGKIERVVGIHDSSKITVSSGSIYVLDSTESSRVDISGGSFFQLSPDDSSQVNFSGGSISHTFHSSGDCQVNISGGSIEKYFSTHHSSQVNITGGSIYKQLMTFNSSRVNITGGSMDRGFMLYDQSVITIFGYDFEVNGNPFVYGELTSILGGWPTQERYRHLTGTLLSGELIDNYFRIGNDAKIVLIPEPATFFLLGLGASFLKRRRS